MKREAPEVYEAYVESIMVENRAAETEHIYPFTQPPRIVFRGQVLGLIAVGMVLVLAGYLAFLGHPEWAAGVAVADLVALAGVFIRGGGR